MTEYAPQTNAPGLAISLADPTQSATFPDTERGQPKRWSFYESLINIAIGYGVALVSQLIIFPVAGVQIPFYDNLVIGGWMTLISVVRSYFVRRLFNWIHLQGWYK